MIDVLAYPDPDWSMEPGPRQIDEAMALNEQGRQALDGDDIARAEALFMEAIETVPLIGTPWFNLGLVYKRQRRWRQAAACNRRSLDLGAEEQDPAFWNLGIAATALCDWETARLAWRGYGIDVDGSDGPIEMDLGPSPIRINPGTTGEVVWGSRIDPARIIIENIPLPGSGHRWHDVILHDGEPRGERTWGEHVYPVFDELERWEPSDIPTWECLVTGPADALDALRKRFEDAGGALEDWTAGVRALCNECSQGSPAAHAHGPFLSDATGNHIGVAAEFAAADQLLSEWSREGPGRSRTDLIAVEG